MKEQYPEFAKLPNSWYITNLCLPKWFMKRHAKEIFQNETFKQVMTEYADAAAKHYPTFGGGHYSVHLSFSEGCGLQFVEVFPGEATSLGISTGMWSEGMENTLDGNNIDSPVQALLLYQIWVHYFNALELLHHSVNRGHEN